MNTKYFSLMIICGLSMLCAACDWNVPKDVPKLYSCSVKVVNAEGPVTDVEVVLFGDEGFDHLSIAGTTDAKGIAHLKTIRASWVGNGSPTGKFKVTLNKKANVPDWKSDEEILDLRGSEAEQYDKEKKRKIEEIAKVIPKIFRSKTTTPLSVEVSSAGGEILSVNVSDRK